MRSLSYRMVCHYDVADSKLVLWRIILLRPLKINCYPHGLPRFWGFHLWVYSHVCLLVINLTNPRRFFLPILEPGAWPGTCEVTSCCDHQSQLVKPGIPSSFYKNTMKDTRKKYQLGVPTYFAP